MHRRRLVGIVERAVLGAAMTIVLVVVERRLSKRKSQSDVSDRLVRTCNRDLILSP